MILVGFLAISLISIVYMTLKNGISPMPSGALARRKIIESLKESYPTDIYELGSGFGGLVFALAKAFPDRNIIGVENSPIPWLISFILLKMKGIRNVRIVFGSFWEMDFTPMKTIVCYQYRGGMQRIYQKIEGPTTLISYCFAIDGVAPLNTYDFGSIIKSKLYKYYFN